MTLQSDRLPVVVAGLRTPFARSGSVFQESTGDELARFVTRELLYRTDLPGDAVDAVIFG